MAGVDHPPGDEPAGAAGPPAVRAKPRLGDAQRRRGPGATAGGSGLMRCANAIAVALFALAGCGGDDSTDDAARVVAGYVDDVQAGHFDAACERLTPSAQ